MKLKINKPKSIASIDDSVLDSNTLPYEAYVYEYTNIENGKKYIGSKKGMFDGSSIGIVLKTMSFVVFLVKINLY